MFVHEKKEKSGSKTEVDYVEKESERNDMQACRFGTAGCYCDMRECGKHGAGQQGECGRRSPGGRGERMKKMEKA